MAETQRQERRPRWLETGWKVTVSVVLLGVLAWTQDLSGVFRLMASVAPTWLLLATVVMFAEQTLTAFIWGSLLTCRGLEISMRRVVHIYYSSFFLGTWLPSSSGPDVVRTYYLAKHVDGYEAVGSMLLLRFISLLGLGIFAVTGIYLMPAELPAAALWLSLLLVVGSAGALTIGLTEAPRRLATTILDAVGLQSLGRLLTKLHAAFHAYRQVPGALWRAAALSLLVQFLRILTIYLAGRALGATVPLVDYFVLVPVTTVITLLPVSISGLGVREGAFVYFFSRVGMSGSMAFSLSLLIFGLSLVLWVVGAVLYWRRRP